MNESAPNDPAPKPAPSPPSSVRYESSPTSPSFSGGPGLGFAIGAVAWIIPLACQTKSTLLIAIYGLIFAAYILPLIAAILACSKTTRAFGLGMLLACGLGWLVLGAICGGLID